MGLFDKIRRHAAVARGDFATMFKIDSHNFVECIVEVKESLGEILVLFGLSDRYALRILDDLVAAAKDPVEAEAV